MKEMAKSFLPVVQWRHGDCDADAVTEPHCWRERRVDSNGRHLRHSFDDNLNPTQGKNYRQDL